MRVVMFAFLIIGVISIYFLTMAMLGSSEVNMVRYSSVRNVDYSNQELWAYIHERDPRYRANMTGVVRSNGRRIRTKPVASYASGYLDGYNDAANRRGGGASPAFFPVPNNYGSGGIRNVF